MEMMYSSQIHIVSQCMAPNVRARHTFINIFLWLFYACPVWHVVMREMQMLMYLLCAYTTNGNVDKTKCVEWRDLGTVRPYMACTMPWHENALQCVLCIKMSHWHISSAHFGRQFSCFSFGHLFYFRVVAFFCFFLLLVVVCLSFSFCSCFGYSLDAAFRFSFFICLFVVVCRCRSANRHSLSSLPPLTIYVSILL